MNSFSYGWLFHNTVTHQSFYPNKSRSHLLPDYFVMTADWEQYLELEKTLAHYCRALGHPARVAILRAIVTQGNLVEGEIVDVPQLSRNTVIQHLRELKRSGLLIGRIFGAKAHYQINPEALKAFKHFADSFFDGMDGVLVKEGGE